MPGVDAAREPAERSKLTMYAHKTSRYVPSLLRPFATRLGLEQDRLRHAVRETMLRAQLPFGKGIRHVYGPDRLKPASDEVVVLCLVRNGAPWLHTFVSHHLRLGAKHIVFLDNGSTDNTGEAAAQYEQVSVFSTDLPFEAYKVALKRWLLKRFHGSGWGLYCDVDELFDYPFSSTLEFPQFLQYLNQQGYTAVAAQMLDMFSAEPLPAIQGRVDQDLTGVYSYYDIADIVKARDKYWLSMNDTVAKGLFLHRGGVRAKVFGWTGSMLTKHPLIRVGSGVKVFPYDDHFVTNSSLADVTAIIRHYKFTGAFLNQIEDYTARKREFNDSGIYNRYREVLKEAGLELTLYGPSAREFRNAEELLESGFLIASERYRRWAQINA